MLISVGSPPPPRVPGDTDPPVGLPLSWKFIFGIIITMPIIAAPNAPPTCAPTCAIDAVVGYVEVGYVEVVDAVVVGAGL